MEALTFITPLTLALIPVVTGLVEIVKGVGVPSQFAPIAAIIMGIGLSALVVTGLPAIIIGGIVVGLSSSGLYSGVKALRAG